MKGMALAESQQGKEEPPGNSMAENRYARIFGTGGIKTAGLWQKRRKYPLIQSNYEEQTSLTHGDAPIRRKAFSSSRCTLRKSIVADSRRAITFMSTGGSNVLWHRKISLVKRFILLRTTADPIFLLAVIPRRGTSRPFSCQTTRKPLTDTLEVALRRATKSARFRSRIDLGNVLTWSTHALAGILLCGNANSQILATLCSPALDDKTSVFRCHSHKKTVGSFTGGIARLECSFHGFTPG
jgi:hypothetical protein